MPDKQVAIVTGANRGIGKEVCRQLAKEGVTVILTARDKEKGRAAADDLAEDGVQVEFHQLDVTSAKSIDALMAFVEKKFGRLDILINNAGIFHRGANGPLDVSLEDLREALETNSLGPMRLAQAAIPLMAKNGYGRIVNVSSGMGQLTGMTGDNSPYRLSKTALNAVTKLLAGAVESLGADIKVNCVCPGWVRTDMGGADAHRSVEEGARGLVDLALIGADGPNGGYFRDMQPMEW